MFRPQIARSMRSTIAAGAIAIGGAATGIATADTPTTTTTTIPTTTGTPVVTVTASGLGPATTIDRGTTRLRGAAAAATRGTRGLSWRSGSPAGGSRVRLKCHMCDLERLPQGGMRQPYGPDRRWAVARVGDGMHHIVLGRL